MGAASLMLRLLLYALFFLYVVGPLAIVFGFRQPEIESTIKGNQGPCLVASVVVLAGGLKFGRWVFLGCLAVCLASLIYEMDMHLYKPEWKHGRAPLTGEVAVVTGSNSGLGFASAKALAGLGAHVVLTCRSLAKCEQAVLDVAAAGRLSGGTAEAAVLDLGSLASAETLAHDLLKKHPKIKLLINNAGTTPQHPLTKDGFEDGFGTMYLAHVTLSLGLMPALTAAGRQGDPARVVMVSSHAAVAAALASFGDAFKASLMVGDGEGDFRGEETRGDGTTFGSIQAYGRAKLAQFLFASEFSRRTAGHNLFVISHSLHTGGVYTPSSTSGLGGIFTRLPGASFLIEKVYMPLLWRSPEQGASTILFAAMGAEPSAMLSGGEWVDALCHAARQDSSKPMEAMRKADARWGPRLWEVTMRLLKEKNVGHTMRLLEENKVGRGVVTDAL